MKTASPAFRAASSSRLPLSMTLAATMAAALLSACGGGGSAGVPMVIGDKSVAVVPPAPTPAKITDADASSGIYKNSYTNLKGLWANSAPPDVALTEYANAFGQFDSSGQLAMFSAHQTYQASPASNTSATAAEATPAEFFFSSWNSVTQQFEKNTSLLKASPSKAPCSDVRKFLVADFNNDGKPDVFVTCMGWTHAPYPGDTNRLVSSQADGVYDIVDVPALSRAFTSAAAADVDGDGDVDVVLLMDSDTTPLQVLLNDGAGHFSLETGARLPAIGEGYYTMEFADVNGDGLLDVLVGGHELSGNRPTLVYVNPGDNRFANVVPIVVPKATDAAGADVLDFTVTGDTAHRTLWVLRSSHAGHQGRVIQRIDWSSLQSGQGVYTSVFNAPSGNAHWLAPAWVNGNLQLVSDDAAMNALMAQTLDLFL